MKWPKDFSTNPYPESEEFLQFLHSSNEDIYLEYLINLWLSEGIPKFILENPEKYQYLRENIAAHLKINSKNITLIGSARLGYSLNPDKYGDSFQSDKSDLDLCVIDNHSFEIFTSEFNDWLSDYKNSIIKPKGKYEKQYWYANSVQEPRKIERGVFDLNRIPTRGRYQNGEAFLEFLSQETIRWNDENDKYRIKKMTIRLYTSWNAFVSQNKINLNALKNKIKQ